MLRTKSNARDVARQVANLVAIPLGIAINYLPRFTGDDVGSVSRETQPLLAAAGWAFAIWGAIFLGQLVYAVYQALPSQRANPTLRRIGWWTALNGVLGGAWTLAFTSHRFTAAWAIMLGILATLVAIEVRRGEDARKGPELLLVRAPFALNLGWISVATILNTSQFLHEVVRYDGAPFSPVVWSVAMVAVATALAFAMGALRQNLAFCIAVCWGLLGVYDFERTVAPAVGWAALVGALAIGVLVIAELLLLATRRVEPAPRHTLRSFG